MSGTSSHNRPVAVFDFDKTLIDSDVAYHFLNTAIKASKVRRMVVGMLTPVLLPFFLIRPTRIIAMSMMMWIATFPIQGKTPRNVFGSFAPRVWSPPINARFYDEGLNALAAHRRLGHRLLIISGSPQELVRQVAQPVLEGDIEIIGSPIAPFLGGLIYRSYCMGIGKIQLARELGVLDNYWDYGYSDSATDIPLLAHCRHRFLVNPDKETIKRTKAALGDRVTILKWTITKNKTLRKGTHGDLRIP
ncbi:haloacid dehalogenase-like hydrolase [uncultured Desulfosarcina sp.]|uniref:haloacid dehalogenase-like hydrolase n=1 Tax=uncultured Desulfosarcina sp. TaxID=218289 RepID=UPI0029C91F18|nr:haloacid dehalogenase-like hydrolase [uncultured Desulfosarcina sp.]